MRRNNTLLKKRLAYVMKYLNDNQHKQMKTVVAELSESLFLTERTIYSIISAGLKT